MFRISVCLAALMLLFGCSARSAISGAPTPTVDRMPEAELEPASEPALPPSPDACPSDSPSTWVGHQDLDEGAALVLTTSEDIARLRSRVATLEIPGTLRRLERRLDNIRGGVRIVFEARESGGVGSVRRAVGEAARDIARTCGLPLALRPSSADEQPAVLPTKTADIAPASKPTVAPPKAPVVPAKAKAKAPAPPTAVPAPSAAPTTTRARPSQKLMPPSSLQPRPGERAPRRPGLL